jgi:hypothetical protein
MHIQLTLSIAFLALDALAGALTLNAPVKRQTYTQNEPITDTLVSLKKKSITAFKKELVLSKLKTKDAKHLTLWYKVLELDKQTASNRRYLQNAYS